MKKKTRFEVFKRDLFTCQYCGNKPPSVILEVDHIIPKSKGGSDDIDNLVCSCFDCNRGKSNVELNLIPKTLSDKLNIEKEKSSQLSEYNKFIKSKERNLSKWIEDVNKIYNYHFPNKILSDKFKNTSVRKFVKTIGVNDVKDAMDLACTKVYYDEDASINYFCGICWRKIREGDN